MKWAPNNKAKTGGRTQVRSLVVSVALALGAAPVASSQAPPPEISVTESAGVYSLAAEFSVAAPPSVVLAALTDYDRIPEFMPEVRTSQVRERGDNRAVVEQEAVAKFLIFSKRIRLLLEVEESEDGIRFRDRCGKSFSLYEGAWTVAGQEGGTRVRYALAANPTFDVPGALLKRLMKRDATEMIGRLTSEIHTRAQGRSPSAR